MTSKGEVVPLEPWETELWQAYDDALDTEAYFYRMMREKGMRDRIACPDCSEGKDYYVMMQFHTAGFYQCTVCRRVHFPEEKKMACIDRSDLEDPTGKYAMIRPDSNSGHSPSTRYKTEAKAIEGAKRVVCSAGQPQTLEVVRIVARVTTQNEARVTRVR